MFKSPGKGYLGAMTQRQIRRNMSFEKIGKDFTFERISLSQTIEHLQSVTKYYGNFKKCV